MISTRDILRKIRAVRSIEQITRAMKTVASVRLRRAEQRLLGARPYRRELAHLVSQLISAYPSHPFLAPRPAKRTAIVLVTGDRGLCGGYNMAAVRRALAMGDPRAVAIIALGRKGLRQMARRGYDILDQLVPLGSEPEAQAVAALARRTGERYLTGEVDRVVLVYSRFLGGASYRVEPEVLLPIEGEAAEPPDIIFEPAPARLVPSLLERYLRSGMLLAALEGSASEHAARVAAMTAATDNAEDMIGELTKLYNTARQAGITRELIEIVGAAEATA